MANKTNSLPLLFLIAMLSSPPRAEGAIEIFLDENETLSVRVDDEMMTNRIIAGSFRDADVKLPEIGPGKFKWLWLVAQRPRLGGLWWWNSPQYGKNLALQWTDPFVAPQADAILFLTAVSTQPYNDSALPFKQTGREVRFPGDFAFKWKGKFPERVTEHVNTGGLAAVVELDGIIPPGVTEEVYFRCEAARITDANDNIDLAPPQGNVASVNEEGFNKGGSWRTQCKGLGRIDQGETFPKTTDGLAWCPTAVTLCTSKAVVIRPDTPR